MDSIFDFILNILKKTVMPFTVSIIFLTIFGYFFGDDMAQISPLSTGSAISYITIFQLLSLSIFIGFINTLFASTYFLRKILFLSQNILRIIIIVFITIIYIVLFDWFPLNNILAWIGFIIAFGICLILSLSISLYITHKQDQEYQVLLKHYQKKKTQKRN